MKQSYDALLIVSFGGPEGMDEVRPFLENVLRGKNVPRQRMLEVAQHYKEFGGVSPINEQNRRLIAALEGELQIHGPRLPIFWGNRNWHPLLADTLKEMSEQGVKRALAFVTSAYGSYSSCRQYLEDIERARRQVGSDAPEVEKLRAFYNHPGFIEPNIDRVRQALHSIAEDRRSRARLVFCAHSIPLSMSRSSRYVEQLREASRLIGAAVGRQEWDLVYQSRSGPPQQAWLEPDICEHLEQLSRKGLTDVVVAPIGFISDHLEVLYDLDSEAADRARELNLNLVRAATVGADPRFVEMIRELILERMGHSPERRFLGTMGPEPDFCPADCCPLPGAHGQVSGSSGDRSL